MNFVDFMNNIYMYIYIYQLLQLFMLIVRISKKKKFIDLG